MSKSEVYSWRVSPETKGRLEAAAREKQLKVAEIVDHAVSEWLGRHARDAAGDQQEKLHAAARKAMGTIAGGNPRRAATAKDTLREAFAERRRKNRSR